MKHKILKYSLYAAFVFTLSAPLWASGNGGDGKDPYSTISRKSLAVDVYTIADDMDALNKYEAALLAMKKLDKKDVEKEGGSKVVSEEEVINQARKWVSPNPEFDPTKEHLIDPSLDYPVSADDNYKNLNLNTLRPLFEAALKDIFEISMVPLDDSDKESSQEIIPMKSPVKSSASNEEFDIFKVRHHSSSLNEAFAMAIACYESKGYQVAITALFPIFAEKAGVKGVDNLLEDCYALCYVCYRDLISSCKLYDGEKLVQMNRMALALDYFSRATDSKTRAIKACEKALQIYREALEIAKQVRNVGEVDLLDRVVNLYKDDVDMRISVGRRVLMDMGTVKNIVNKRSC